MFDLYTLKARIYPIVLLFFPIVVLGVIYSIHFESLKQITSSALLVGALTYLFSQLGRDEGKKREQRLWADWGGAPSIQILRWQNSIIDNYTKKRYHDKLQVLCPVPVLPDVLMETNNPAAADQVYKAWNKYLLFRSRNVKMYPLLAKENASYGFRRNLWGIRSYALGFLILLTIANYGYFIFITKVWNPFLPPLSLPFLFSTITLLSFLCLWIFGVRKSWIRVPALAYAERLLEITESITIENQ